METPSELEDAEMDFPQGICDHIASHVRDAVDLCSLRSVSKMWKLAVSYQIRRSTNINDKAVDLDDAKLMRMVNAFPKLTLLMPKGELITADGLAEACSALRRTIHTVDLRMCPKVTRSFLELLAVFPNIRCVPFA